jgi:hypothetical protein
MTCYCILQTPMRQKFSSSHIVSQNKLGRICEKNKVILYNITDSYFKCNCNGIHHKLIPTPAFSFEHEVKMPHHQPPSQYSEILLKPTVIPLQPIS